MSFLLNHFILFGTGVGGVTLAPSIFTDTDSFFAPTVARGSVALTPGLFTDTDSFFAPVVDNGGEQTLAPPLFSDGDTFFSPVVTRGALTLAPAIFTDTDSFFAPAVAQVTVLHPSLFTDPDTFFSPTMAVFDPHWTSVMLLCGFNGSDGATSFTDESSFARTLTGVGTAQLDTAQSIFGGSSLLLDGIGDYITVPVSTDFDFPGQFTIEMRVRNATSADANAILISKYGATQADKAWAFGTFANDYYFWFFNAAGTERDTNVAFVPTINTWYTLCVDRDASGVVRLYRDGAMLVKATWNEAIRAGATPQVVSIGRLGGNTNFDVSGWIDELRVTKGVARYASDGGYTVPLAAFSRS